MLQNLYIGLQIVIIIACCILVLSYIYQEVRDRKNVIQKNGDKMNADRFDSVFVQQGNSSTLRVPNQKKFYVVKEEWQGSLLLNTLIIGEAHDTRHEAEDALTRYNAAKALGSIRTPHKAKVVADNGGKGSPESHRRGGRPKGSRNRPKPE